MLAAVFIVNCTHGVVDSYVSAEFSLIFSILILVFVYILLYHKQYKHHTCTYIPGRVDLAQ